MRIKTRDFGMHVYLKQKNMKQLCVAIFLFLFQISFAQQPPKPNAVEVFEAIQKLNFFGNVMYVAAHPDDENTRLITYFSKHYHAHTTYISLTRGDGGQNLIGADLNEKLGIIRTQELLEARKIDGGHQLFTRAIDFGYSKNPTEALSTWNEQKVLADLVYAIRLQKPDIIVNRFDHRTPGTTHGHHTASAMLSMKAFDLAGKENAFPEQLNTVEVWQPKAVYFNDSWFFYGSQEAFEKANHEQHLSLNIGEYYEDVGLANNEIAALSRSMHKSQGFGNTGSRGDQIEYLELLKGKLPSPTNVFEHIETSWTKLESRNAKKIEELLEEVEQEFNFQAPSESLPKLIEAYDLLKQTKTSFWKERKLSELKEIILACSGLFVEAKTSQAYTNPGKVIQVFVEATNQTKTDVELKAVEILGTKLKQISNNQLKPNQRNEWEVQVKVPENENISNPFWLNKSPSDALYSVDDLNIRNLPKLKNTLPVQFQFKILDQTINYTSNLVYKYNDPVRGEVYENFQILPPVSVSFEKEIMVFSNNQSKYVDLKLVNYGIDEQVSIKFETAAGWKIEPNQLSFNFENSNQIKNFQLKVTPPKEASELSIKAIAKIGSNLYDSKVEIIDYPHISKQSLVQPNQLKLIKLAVETAGQKVAYITGAGDEVPTAISELGYQVKELSVDEISLENINSFDAVVVGIRAFNIHDQLELKKQVLFNYVKNGGNLIVQYNTSRRLNVAISPLNLQLSRKRVTNENAEVQFLAPQHPVLNYPNSISSQDFENWVQERGLYFPESWDAKFTPILAMQDPNEPVLKGSLLVAKYGKGYYTYTGLSFFRQLPAGVVGAYRLFANLLSLGNEKE